MNGKEIRAWRERQKPSISQRKLADVLSEALGRKYDGSTVSKWENAKDPVPEHVSAFMASLALEQRFPSGDAAMGEGYEEPEQPTAPPGESARGAGDTAPPPPPGEENARPVPALLPHSNAYTRACEELWEGIAAIVGSVGAVTGNQAVTQDGRIILQHKERLGVAWGHLAESNETVRRWLTAGAISGAWIEVLIATAILGNQIGDNHRAHAALKRQEREEGDGGDGRVVPFAAPGQ